MSSPEAILPKRIARKKSPIKSVPLSAEYDGTEIVTDAEINGITVASYRSVEESEGASYNVITYAFEDNGEYVEVAFWLDGLTAEAEAEAIISTLNK